jgi:hypothetical protein
MSDYLEAAFDRYNVAGDDPHERLDGLAALDADARSRLTDELLEAMTAAEGAEKEEIGTALALTMVATDAAKTGALTAAAGATPSPRLPALGTVRAPGSHAPNVDRTATRVMVSDTGDQLSNGDLVAKVTDLYDQSLRGNLGTGEGRMRAVRVESPPPVPERTLTPDDIATNDARIGNVVSLDAITASGGLCGPSAPYFPELVVSDMHRPVRDALVGFDANRGQISFNPPPKPADVASGTALWTAATDANPGGSTKAAVKVSCPGVQTVQCSAIYEAIEFSNFDSRANGERVEALLGVLHAQHARTAEQTLLDLINTKSTAVTATQVMGLFRDYIPYIEQEAQGMRSRWRMPPDFAIRLLLPQWARGAIRADLQRQPPGDNALNVSDARIDSFFTDMHVIPTWYADSRTGGNQVFGGQAASDLGNYPGGGGGITKIESFMFAEGSWLFLNGGVLELGIVRDSSLNAVNNCQFFSESFESAAFVGLESQKLTTTVCASGIVPSASSSSAYCNAS